MQKSIELAKQEGKIQVVQATAQTSVVILIVVSLILGVLFVSITLAFLLSWAFKSYILGFASISLVYILIFLYIYLNRKSLKSKILQRILLQNKN